MKIKLTQTMKDVEGADIITPDKRQLTLGNICINSILTPVPDDDVKVKYEKYEIYKKLKQADGEIEMKAEDIVLLKKVIGKFQPPLIMGQCFDIIEGKENA